MASDEDQWRKPPAFIPGQDVSTFSIGDLDQTMQALQSEIARLAEIRTKKLASQAAADMFFRKPG